MSGLPPASPAVTATRRDALFSAIHAPDILPDLLLAGSSSLAAHTSRAAYGELVMVVPAPGLADDQQVRSSSRRKLDNVFRYPHLGRHVRTLAFRHQDARQTRYPLDQAGRPGQRQDIWDLAVGLIGLCPNLEILIWEIGLGVGSGLWKAIAELKHLRRLDIVIPPLDPNPETLSTFPRITPDPQLLLPPGLGLTPTSSDDHVKTAFGRAKIIGLGGWGLGVAWEGLEVLRLSNLSQVGAKTLAAHLTMLADHPSALHTLAISTHFLDLSLAIAVGRLGTQGVLRYLELSTSGTNFKADSIQEIMSGCRGLESFVLNDIEGRLDRNTWSMIDEWPETLRGVDIRITESTNHHSWSLHHLNSIHDLPIAQLTHLAVRRVNHPTAELPLPPRGVTVPPVQTGYTIEPLPRVLLDVIKDAGVRLQGLCLDWWSVDTAEVEALMKAVPRIRHIRLAVQASMIKITTMTTAFSANPELEQLEIVSNPEHQSVAGPTKTCASPEELAMLPESLAQTLAEGDSTLPDIRDLRKIVRRLPRLKQIVWAGRGGKGTWTFSKKSASSLLVNVVFVHAAISTLPIWYACQQVGPSFEYEDEPHGRILEIRPSTAMHADLPTLSRSTTNSSSRTVLHTPLTNSPVLTRREMGERRGSLVTSPKSPSIPEMACLTIDTRARRMHGRSKSVSEVVNASVGSPPSPPCTSKSLFKTPQSSSSTARDAAAQRRAQREDRIRAKAAASVTVREIAAQLPKQTNGDRAPGILSNVARQVPGSGRTAGVVKNMEKRLRPKTQKVEEYVPIAEVEESGGEEGSQLGKGADGWTTVVKEKGKDKKPAVEIKDKVRGGRRAKK